MIQQIINCIEPLIKELPFVENYGGLVQCVTKTEIDETTGAKRNITFPITCNANPSTCLKQGGYSALIPGKCKSLFYFEASNLRPKGCIGPKGKTYVWEGTLSLIGWVNLRSLGVEICGNVDFIIACILSKGIVGRCNFTGPMSGTAIVGLPTIRINDPKIFQKYSYYSKLKDKIMYPYQYFALDFPVRIEIQQGCIDAEICEPDEDQEPIVCTVV